MHEEAKKKEPGYGTYLAVWGTMAALTIVAATAGRAAGAGLIKLLPVLIALTKTFLILSFFMNLRYEKGFLRLIILFAIGVIVILGLFLFSDVGFR